MSIHTSAHSPGVFMPEELSLLRSLMDEMRNEAWFPQSDAMREKFAAFVIRSYDRGIRCPDKLRPFCAVAARLYFSERTLAH